MLTKITKEAQEQKWLCYWFWMKYPKILMFAIPNGGYRRPQEAVSLRKQGVTPGVPDLMIAAPRGRYHGLFVELKRTPIRNVKGKVSAQQEKIIKYLNGQNYAAYVAHGWVEAQEIIDAYLEHGNAL